MLHEKTLISRNKHQEHQEMMNNLTQQRKSDPDGGTTINIGGGNDKHSRYQRPAVESTLRGRGNGKWTSLDNLEELIGALVQKADESLLSNDSLLKFMGNQLGTGRSRSNGLRGWHNKTNLEQLIEDFINQYVICTICGSPDTRIVKKNRKGACTSKCTACGHESAVSDSRLFKVKQQKKRGKFKVKKSKDKCNRRDSAPIPDGTGVAACDGKASGLTSAIVQTSENDIIRAERQKVNGSVGVGGDKAQPTCNVCLIGHVAHGKSTLCKQLGGKRTQQHQEERLRGCTIKLGYSSAKIYRCEGSCPAPSCFTSAPSDSLAPPCPLCGGCTSLQRHVSFVDCPGHQSYMSKMLTGAALADAALMVVAADKGPQKQTLEHLAVVKAMGMEHVAFVQNKIELVSEVTAKNCFFKIRRLATQLDGPKPIFPISAQLGLNIGSICQWLASLPARRPTPPHPQKVNPVADHKSTGDFDRSGTNFTPCRLFVARSFDINKPGTALSKLQGGVAGGTVVSGVVRSGDVLEMRPGLVRRDKNKGFTCLPLLLRVTSIRSEKRRLDFALPGGLVALGTSLDPGVSKQDCLAGQVIGTPGSLPPVCSILTLMVAQLFPVDGHKNLAKQCPVRLQVGTKTVFGIVTKRYKSPSKTGGQSTQKVRVTLEEPVCVDSATQKVAVSLRTEQSGWRLYGWASVAKMQEVKLLRIPPVHPPEVDAEFDKVVHDATKDIAAVDSTAVLDMGRVDAQYKRQLQRLHESLHNKTGLMGKTHKVTVPIFLLVRDGSKKTRFANFSQVCKAIRRPAKHFSAFLSAEIGRDVFGAPDGSLVMSGRYNAKLTTQLFASYFKKYVQCKQCQSADTQLERDRQDRAHYLRCTNCHARHPVVTISKGVRALERGARRATRNRVIPRR